jgi:hypothetical protein
MKNKKHDRVVDNKEKEKRKTLDRLATQILKQDEHNQKMKGYVLKKNPLDLF